MESLLEYLISKENKKKVASNLKSFLCLYDIVNTISNGWYMVVDEETAKKVNIPNEGDSKLYMVCDPPESLGKWVQYIPINELDDNLIALKTGSNNTIVEIYRNEKYKFKEKDLSKDVLLYYVFKDKNWKKVYERK